jgi:hypothetical protein
MVLLIVPLMLWTISMVSRSKNSRNSANITAGLMVSDTKEAVLKKRLEDRVGY